MLKLRPILVIEDSNDDFMFLQVCLENAGVSNRLIRCSTRMEIETFLEEAKTSNVLQRPIFVFLDLNLPGFRGADVLQRMKEHPTLASTPVVVLTTSSQPSDVTAVYRLGASGFLTKPLSFEKFEEMVQQVAAYWFSCVRLPEVAGTTET